MTRRTGEGRGIGTRRHVLWRWGAPVVALTVALGGPGLLGHAGAAPDPICGTGTPGSGATTATCTYSATNAEQTFIVPKWVSGVHVVAVGAPGGGGGLGDQVSADLSVGTGQLLAAGQTLYVEVGGPGGQPGGTAGGAGGFNGGASGGPSAVGTISGSGGGGGGASDVRTTSNSNAATTLASRLLVAGGGGGAGGGGVGTATGTSFAGLASGGPGGGGTGGNSATSSAGGTGGTANIVDPQDSTFTATGDGGGGGGGGISGGARSTSGGGASASGFNALACSFSDAGGGTSGTGGPGSGGCNGTVVGTGNVAAGGGGGGGGGVIGGGGGRSGGLGCASSTGTSPFTWWCAVGGGGGGGGGSSLVPTGGSAATAAAGTSPQVIITYALAVSQVSVPSLSATEGAAVSGVVATFSALNPTDTFSAMIAWGDGTTSAGTVAGTGTDTFSATGSHTYAEEGSYTIMVTVTDQTANASGQATGTATVADAGLTITQSAVAAPGGRPVALGATFTDADPQGTVTDYQATIAWGDGTTSAGVVTTNPLGAGFAVAGTHLYSAKGTYTVRLTVKDQGGSNAAVTKTVVVH